MSRGLGNLVAFSVVFALLLMWSVTYWNIERSRLLLEEERVRADKLEIKKAGESLLVEGSRLDSDYYSVTIRNRGPEEAVVRYLIGLSSDDGIAGIKAVNLEVGPGDVKTVEVRFSEVPEGIVIVTSLGNVFKVQQNSSSSYPGSRPHLLADAIVDNSIHHLRVNKYDVWSDVVELGPINFSTPVRVVGIIIQLDWYVSNLAWFRSYVDPITLSEMYPDGLFVSVIGSLGSGDKKYHIAHYSDARPYYTTIKRVIMNCGAVGDQITVRLAQHNRVARMKMGNYVTTRFQTEVWYDVVDRADIYVTNIRVSVIYERLTS